MPVILVPAKELDELYAEIFILNMSIIPAPAKELEEIYATFHTKFESIPPRLLSIRKIFVSFISKVLSCVYFPLPKKICVKFHIKSVVLCVLSSSEEDLCRVSCQIKVLSCMYSPLPKKIYVGFHIKSAICVPSSNEDLY